TETTQAISLATTIAELTINGQGLLVMLSSSLIRALMFKHLPPQRQAARFSSQVLRLLRESPSALHGINCRQIVTRVAMVVGPCVGDARLAYQVVALFDQQLQLR